MDAGPAICRGPGNFILKCQYCCRWNYLHFKQLYQCRLANTAVINLRGMSCLHFNSAIVTNGDSPWLIYPTVLNNPKMRQNRLTTNRTVEAFENFPISPTKKTMNDVIFDLLGENWTKLFKDNFKKHQFSLAWKEIKKVRTQILSPKKVRLKPPNRSILLR